LSGTDMAAFVLAVLAVLYAALWLRDRERGMSWLAASFALLALWYATSDLHLVGGTHIDRSSRGWASVVLVSTLLMTVGLVDYLGAAPRLRRIVLAALLAPGLVLLGFYLAAVPVPRSLANAAALLCYVGTAALAFRSAHGEPGAGHAFIGLALVAIPAWLAVLLARQADLLLLRYHGVLPVLFFGLTLLTVSLLRRRRALEAEVGARRRAEQQLTTLNAQLEQKVGERTADLQSMVAGLESFNRNVSHDLRGPLGGIEGLARMSLDALRRGDADVALRVLPTIASQAEISHKLVEALLELARVGDATLQRQEVDLAALVRETVEQLCMGRASARLPAIQLGELPTVLADADLLRPVFVNLIGNALKFSRDGADARIEIGACANDEGHVVCVRDNGVGFAPGAAARLFEPFTRLHGPRYEGHGVGLSIVRRAVERHGGRAWAEAVPQGGAAFYFSLPRSA